jgi:hypothetical protein
VLPTCLSSTRARTSVPSSSFAYNRLGRSSQRASFSARTPGSSTSMSSVQPRSPPVPISSLYVSTSWAMSASRTMRSVRTISWIW